MLYNPAVYTLSVITISSNGLANAAPGYALHLLYLPAYSATFVIVAGFPTTVSPSHRQHQNSHLQLLIPS
jgi:hypothetical protein